MVVVLALLTVSLAVHETAHAWVAWKCGDSTAKDLGRITLNPLPHIDLFQTILLPAMVLIASNGAFYFGGAKPVPVSFSRLRHPWRDMALVAVAGPLSNVLLAILAALTWKVALDSGLYRKEQRLDEILGAVALFNLLLAVFNMLPIPPLDGSRILAWLLPGPLRASYAALDRFGLLIVIVAVYFVPGVSAAVNGALVALARVVLWIVPVEGLW